MLGIDSEIGTSTLHLWIAAGSAALLVALCVLAYVRPLAGMQGAVARIGAVVVGAFLGGLMAWTLAATGEHGQDVERRALEMRAHDLDALALAPGSPLACLNGVAGESVEAACEKTLFANPATVASAASYVAARFALLADMESYSRRAGVNIDAALSPLRHSLEADRFGFVADVLATRDGCTGTSCKALAVLRDPSHVRANLSGGAFDHRLEQYLAIWAQSPEVPGTGAELQTSALGGPGAHKVILDADFPSAESIPAVSIMNPEPKGPVVPGAAAAAAIAGEPNPTHATAAAPARRAPPRKQASNPPATDVAPVEPVWAPGATNPVAPSTANAAPTGAPPVQLNPFPTQPGASSNAPVRAQ